MIFNIQQLYTQARQLAGTVSQKPSCLRDLSVALGSSHQVSSQLRVHKNSSDNGDTVIIVVKLLLISMVITAIIATSNHC